MPEKFQLVEMSANIGNVAEVWFGMLTGGGFTSSSCSSLIRGLISWTMLATIFLWCSFSASAKYWRAVSDTGSLLNGERNLILIKTNSKIFTQSLVNLANWDALFGHTYIIGFSSNFKMIVMPDTTALSVLLVKIRSSSKSVVDSSSSMWMSGSFESVALST